MTRAPTSRRDDSQTSLRALPPEAKPELRQEHEALSAFVGVWRGTGRGHGDNAMIEETYEWVEGKFFLHSRFDQRFGSVPHIGVGMIGYNAQNRRYFAHMVDNLGYDRTYDLRHEGDGVWSYAGERERARLNFRGDALNVRWEHRPNGGTWEELCEYDLIKQHAGITH